MLSRTLLAMAMALALTLAVLAPCAVAQGVSNAAPPAAPAREVRAWLLRIHEAASRHNFQGTFVVSSAGHVASARIAHYEEGSNQFERIESLDGRARNVFRHNDVVHTLWPGSRVALIEKRGLLNSFPALLQGGDDGITDSYDVRPDEPERVAGHEANVLIVKPKDALRYGYRLWADKGSGLLLRVDVIGERGEVLETSAFSDVTIDIRAQPDSVLQAMKRLDGYRVLRPVLRQTALEAEGWAMRPTAPGFRRVSCVSRQIDAANDGGADPGGPPVLQTIYSDGLTYVSVFIEPFRPQLHVRPMIASIGATQTLSQRQGEWWVTVVGDVPAATLRLFASALERKK